jgi:hypothetical protein
MHGWTHNEYENFQESVEPLLKVMIDNGIENQILASQSRRPTMFLRSEAYGEESGNPI